MSSKKKTRSQSGDKLKEHKANLHPRWKLLPLEEPDVSSISKVAEANQLEELDDSFDHPLHSTAVDAYGEEHLESESHGHVSAPQRKNTGRSRITHRDVQNFSTADPEKKKKRTPNTTQHQVEKQQPSENTSDSSVDSSCSIQLWHPKKLKRSARDITELDVVLTEFEKITANYGQSVESDIGRKTIDGFCSAFKDQITDLFERNWEEPISLEDIAEVQELKNMKKKNAKVLRDIKRKRLHLLQLREELVGAEPQVTELEREYAELQERKSSLGKATELLTDLKDLQQDYLDYREKNSKVQLVYGTSSLPALLVESRRILGAEKHFQNINKKLEEALAVQKGKLSKKH